MIAIIDYGVGNLNSIRNMLARVGAASVPTRDPDEIRRASGLILPGVGAFDHAMAELSRFELIPVLEEMALERKVPVLGVCLGMQLLGRGSEEGALPGLGWLRADCRRFRFDPPRPDLKIPHMGWNIAAPARPSVLFPEGAARRFYFVHSYRMACDDPGDVLAVTDHGGSFVSAAGRGNILGVQFHPEKSHVFGMKLLANFAGAL